ncbi:MAG: FAD synthase [Nanoarchaeota archaeon]|nr:FAD synthase [Nanoarchaeota archaeon]
MKRVLAAGTFNLLHPGHVQFLETAKGLGDELVVIVATDATAIKGKGYVLLPAASRVALVRALRCVDRARIGNEGDVLAILEEERPAVVALGFDQPFTEDVITRRATAIGFPCKVVRLPKFGNWSTRSMMNNKRKRKKGK